MFGLVANTEKYEKVTIWKKKSKQKVEYIQAKYLMSVIVKSVIKSRENKIIMNKVWLCFVALWMIQVCFVALH